MFHDVRKNAIFGVSIVSKINVTSARTHFRTHFAPHHAQPLATPCIKHDGVPIDKTQFCIILHFIASPYITAM